jgi:hypothetical protein
MSNLGDTVANGVLSTQQLLKPGTPLWVCTFEPKMLPRDQDFEIYHGSAIGPGGYFLVYLNDKLYGIGKNGILNEYSPRGSAMYVTKGSTVTVVWSIGTGVIPVVRYWMRTPEVGKI